MAASQPEATKTITPPCLEVLEENATMEKSFAIERSVVSTSANVKMEQSAHSRQGISLDTISEYTGVPMELLHVESLIAPFAVPKAAPASPNTSPGSTQEMTTLSTPMFPRSMSSDRETTICLVVNAALMKTR